MDNYNKFLALGNIVLMLLLLYFVFNWTAIQKEAILSDRINNCVNLLYPNATWKYNYSNLLNPNPISLNITIPNNSK